MFVQIKCNNNFILSFGEPGYKSIGAHVTMSTIWETVNKKKVCPWKGVDWEGRELGKWLEGLEVGETIINRYYMRKESISNKWKK